MIEPELATTAAQFGVAGDEAIERPALRHFRLQFPREPPQRGAAQVRRRAPERNRTAVWG